MNTTGTLLKRVDRPAKVEAAGKNKDGKKDMRKYNNITNIAIVFYVFHQGFLIMIFLGLGRYCFNQCVHSVLRFNFVFDLSYYNVAS